MQGLVLMTCKHASRLCFFAADFDVEPLIPGTCRAAATFLKPASSTVSAFGYLGNAELHAA
jgi:hypothetical protein